MNKLLTATLLILLCVSRAAAQMSVAVGNKAKPTGAAPATDATTGLGFSPKIVFFTMGDNTRTALGNDVGAVATLGVGRSSSEQWLISWNGVDNAATTNTDRRFDNVTVLAGIDQTGTLTDEAAFASLDASGFTITWSPNTANATLYNYMAIGGSSISAKITEQTLSTGSGNVTYAHGLGTTPAVIFILYAARSAAGTASSATNCFGVATANGDQWVLANSAANAATTTADVDALSYARTTMVFAAFSSGAIAYEASFVSMDATNVTLNQSAGFAANHIVLVAIAGGSWKVGSTAKTTGAEPAADTIVSGLSFEPKGIMLASHGKAASSSVVIDAQSAIGFASESAEIHNTNAYKDATLNTQVDSRMSSTKALSILTAGTPTLEAELDISLDASGVTGTWTDNHSTASQILWVTFGDSSSGRVPVKLEQYRRRRI